MQRLLHMVRCRVFIKADEDSIRIKAAFRALFPFSLEEERIAVDETEAMGIETPIRIVSATLTRPRHITAFMKHLNDLLSQEDRAMIMEQRESRLDEEGMFFVRLDKASWIEKQARVTDSGDCFHLTFEIAAFPKNRDVMLALVPKVFNAPTEQEDA